MRLQSGLCVFKDEDTEVLVQRCGIEICWDGGDRLKPAKGRQEC